MGKIRVKSFGDQEEEAKQARKLQRRKEAKDFKKASLDTSESKEETKDEVKEKASEAVSEVKTEETPKEEPKKEKKQFKKDQKAFHSQKYEDLLVRVDRSKTYPIADALELLEKLQRSSFDETVELHINTLTTGVSGNVTLPHGTGKKTRVVIATDALIAEIEKGRIDFDILVAEPQMMPKLAKVAKILGPRGLMPNPKNGTISQNPEEMVKKYEGGQINFKTETKSPIMHLTVGKVSFGPQKLTENINAMITAVKKSNISNVTLKSTMSPGIKIKV